ncbi:MAG: Trk family potassium uptake protein [Limnochordaceae bacterium]|nr:Trk family potassium uptake protein [Limnochordaceae bacterium]
MTFLRWVSGLRWHGLHWTPARVITLVFAAMILSGAIVLRLPVAGRGDQPVSFLTALFTSTSAVCVTGLVVVDTGTRYSTFGHFVIGLLIQMGGLGITSAASIALLMGRRITLRERILLRESLNQETLQGIVRLTRNILLITFGVELTGALLLAMRFVPLWGWRAGIGRALFHSVSAFNNAGLDLFGGFRSLTIFARDPFVLLVIASLLIVGGIGFPVILDVWHWVRRRREGAHLNLHSFTALTVTAGLLLGGTVAILLMEWNNPATLGSLPWSGRVLNAFFQAATPRTAGFNSVLIGSLHQGTLLLIIILMYIGASPASTGGGIKTTTWAAVSLGIWSTIRGHSDVNVRGRRLEVGLWERAATLAVLALGWVVVVTGVLTFTEHDRFTLLQLLFETTSAFGTVGLSTGITPELSPAGQLLIILTMFFGRVGPLTVATALAARMRQADIRYPEDRVLIG